jgi:hypothetical protein
MTAVAGPAICQAVLKSGSNILGTANFTLEVESSPMGADAPPVFTDAGWTWMLNKLNTEFVPALGNETIIDAIDGKADQSDLTALSNTVAGHTGSITVLNNTVNNLNQSVTENRQNISRKLDKNQGTANAGKYLKVGADGNVETADPDVTTDKTLSVADKAADAKAVGDELTDLKADYDDIDDRVTALESGGSGSGLTEDIKVALLQIASKVAYIDENGQDYYDALYNALYPPVDLVSISAVFAQGSAVIYNTDDLNTLKQYLVVTAHMSDSSTQTVTNYALSGTLSVGTSTITVTYGGKTTTFSVVVVTPEWGSDYTWLYKASDGQLLSAKTDLVTASIETGCIETLENGLLKLFVPQKSNKLIRFDLVQQTNTKGKLTAKVKFNSVGYAKAGTGLRLQISNGINGTQIFEHWNGASVYTFGVYEGSTYSDELAFELNAWHIISVERTNTGQVVSVDGTAILESSTMSTNYCSKNSIIAQNSDSNNPADDLDVDIAWITYKNND